jgi:DNA helicase II / ATP-dependent DNA helicase PcrA
MLDPQSLLADLTEPQKEAVMHVDGPLLVLAGPGSGKTRVITRRIAWLVAQGIPAWQILALTFTNKAAGEMRERVERLLPTDVPGRKGLTVTTFHSLCARLLRRYADAAGLPDSFTIYDAADQRDAVKKAIEESGLSTKNWTPASVASEISRAKNQLLDASGYAAQATDFRDRSIAKIYKAYEAILGQTKSVDFDDLLMRMAKMLRDKPAVRAELQERYRYVLIDEYQDTNHAQFMIAHLLVSPMPGARVDEAPGGGVDEFGIPIESSGGSRTAAANICVVGDPDQSVYGWRGADITNILEFEEHFPNAKIIPLGQNFRSSANIVAVAAGLIQHNRRRKHKRLYTELDEGEKPAVVICRDEHHEAALAVDEFRRRREQGISWKDMAVLYRMNALSRVMEDAMRRAQIPYQIARGTAYYERKEVKDLISYLRVVANPADDVALRRVVNTPARGISDATVGKLETVAAQRRMSLLESLRSADESAGLNARAVAACRRFAATVDAWRENLHPTGLLDGAGGTLAEIVGRILKGSGLEDLYRKSQAEEDEERLRNLEELISAAAEFQPAVDDTRDAPLTPAGMLTAFLESIALVSDADAIDPASGAVTLLTLHAAKGLEFTCVALIGMEEGLLPHARAAQSEHELEEERRLCFVGITRAKKHLLMTSAAYRTTRGLRERMMKSHFIEELPAQHITISQQNDPFLDQDEDPVVHTRPFGSEAVRNFPVGCLVRHEQFGIGRIEAVMPRGSSSSARVNFQSVGPKTLVLEFARLQRLA